MIWRIFMAAIAALALFWLAAFVYFINLIPRNAVGDSVSTQAIVVLTGGSLRITYGFELLEKGKAEYLFISGIAKDLKLADVLKQHKASKKVRQIAKEDGRIILGYDADSTRGNAVETAEWVAQRHIRSIRLVTANYHLPRSIMELRRAMPTVIIIADPVFPDRFQMEGKWWQDPVTRALVFSEFHKYLASWILGPALPALQDAART